MSDTAKEKAARLLKKRASISSATSSDVHTLTRTKRQGSMSTISFMDDPSHDAHQRPTVRMEPTYRMDPPRKFPNAQVKGILKDVMEAYLSEERYEAELCRQMTKTLSEVVKTRVKDLALPRYKLICLMHIGSLQDQGLRMGSRCLWDPTNDTFASYEYRNNSLFAVGTVYGIYME